MSADGSEGLLDTMSDLRRLLAARSRRAHNDNAYDEFFLNHHRRIVAVLVRLLGDAGRAEELASEVFWRAYRRSAGSATHDRLGGWLYRTATNLGIEELRAGARRQRYEHAAAQEVRRGQASGTPLDELLHAERSARVRSVLASLKRSQAQILILRSSGLSYGELAELLRINPSSVGTLLARAEAQFQKQYLRLYGSED